MSVHGSNRLCTNSLLDINVFGRRAGIAAAEHAATSAHAGLPPERESTVQAMVSTLVDSTGGERVAEIRAALQHTMDRNAQVYRTDESLEQAEQGIAALKVRYACVAITDKGRRFNSDLLEAIELRPRGIEITKANAEVKRALLYRRV